MREVVWLLLFREISAEAILELDIFNLSADKGKKPPSTSGTTTGTSGGPFSGGISTRRSGIDSDTDGNNNSALFWQPGRIGYYTPRQGRCTPERLNVFRNIGRSVPILHESLENQFEYFINKSALLIGTCVIFMLVNNCLYSE